MTLYANLANQTSTVPGKVIGNLSFAGRDGQFHSTLWRLVSRLDSTDASKDLEKYVDNTILNEMTSERDRTSAGSFVCNWRFKS